MTLHSITIYIKELKRQLKGRGPDERLKALDILRRASDALYERGFSPEYIALAERLTTASFPRELAEPQAPYMLESCFDFVERRETLAECQDPSHPMSTLKGLDGPNLKQEYIPSKIIDILEELTDLAKVPQRERSNDHWFAGMTAHVDGVMPDEIELISYTEPLAEGGGQNIRLRYQTRKRCVEVVVRATPRGGQDRI